MLDWILKKLFYWKRIEALLFELRCGLISAKDDAMNCLRGTNTEVEILQGKVGDMEQRLLALEVDRPDNGIS